MARVAPTLVATAEMANWQLGTTPRSVSSSVSWQTGDIILVHGGIADGGEIMFTPTVSGLSFSLVDSEVTGIGECSTYLWSATAGSNGSGTVQGSASGGSIQWGIAVEVWRGSDGLGDTAKGTSTTKTVSITRTEDASAVSYSGFDWSASSAAATFTPGGAAVIESSGNDLFYGIHVGYWPDEGAAGTTSYGVSSVSSGSFAKMAVEILGAEGEEPEPPAGPYAILRPAVVV